MIAPARHTLRRTRLGAITSALVLIVSIGLPAGAQERGTETARTRTCLDTISSASFVRVPIYLEAKAADTSAAPLLASADTLAMRAVAMIRSSLGDSTTSLPEGEALLQWRQVGGAVRIVAHRDGRFVVWTPSEPGDSVRAPSRVLLVRTLAALTDAGARFGWPAEVAGDSATFDLEQRWADVAPDGTIQPLLIRAEAIPMFSMAMPRSTPLTVRYAPKLLYPPEERGSGVEGVIILEFVVDTTGHVVPSTIRDKWPNDRPRLSGFSGSHYQAFVDVAKRTVSGARYNPARLGGCLISQPAQQPFTFTLSH